MDRSAKTLMGLALGSLCLAIVWTLPGESRPKSIQPESPSQKPTPVLAPPPPPKPKENLIASKL